MKNKYFFVLIMVLGLTACQEDSILPLDIAKLSPEKWPTEPLSREKINNFAYLQLQRFGEFDWSAASDFMVYSAAA